MGSFRIITFTKTTNVFSYYILSCSSAICAILLLPADSLQLLSLYSASLLSSLLLPNRSRFFMFSLSMCFRVCVFCQPLLLCYHPHVFALSLIIISSSLPHAPPRLFEAPVYLSLHFSFHPRKFLSLFFLRFSSECYICLSRRQSLFLGCQSSGQLLLLLLGGAVIAASPLGGAVVATSPLGGAVLAASPLGGEVGAACPLGCLVSSACQLHGVWVTSTFLSDSARATTLLSDSTWVIAAVLLNSFNWVSAVLLSGSDRVATTFLSGSAQVAATLLSGSAQVAATLLSNYANNSYEDDQYG